MLRRTIPALLTAVVALTLAFVALAAPTADPATYFPANLPPPTDTQAVTAREQNDAAIQAR